MPLGAYSFLILRCPRYYLYKKLHFFFQIFYPETTDVYDRKNMPKVIYCIHALRYYRPSDVFLLLILFFHSISKKCLQAVDWKGLLASPGFITWNYKKWRLLCGHGFSISQLWQQGWRTSVCMTAASVWQPLSWQSYHWEKQPFLWLGGARG